jgi:2'-5' RNA ligase
MSVVRAFIAVDLPLEIQDCLDQVERNLQERMGDVPVRWVVPENIHLTLKFLGDVSLNNLDVLTEILQAEAASHESIVISIGGVGAFPKVRNPRVIWVGVEAPEELMALQRGIETHTSRVGYAPDRRPFSPHLTLGRVSRNSSPGDVRKIGDVLKDCKVGFLGVARIKAVHLYRSDLKPDGAEYTRLYTADFGE